MIFDVAVIGSGPSGVSAAWPLVKKGLNVIMLDQGNTSEQVPDNNFTFKDIRINDKDQWQYFIGKDFVGLSGEGNETPKFKVPSHKHVWDGFLNAYDISSKNFHPTGSLAKGGLSKMWGAGPYTYNRNDFKNLPINYEDISEAYLEISQRIGISGSLTDDLAEYLEHKIALQAALPLHPNADYILKKYNNKSNSEIILGLARNAVITSDLGQRKKCELTNRCFWGCPRDSIYTADQEICELENNENFTYESNSFVNDFSFKNNIYKLYCEDRITNRSNHTISANTIVLAAGAIGSSLLALRASRLNRESLPLVCHPAFALLMLIPGRIGSLSVDRGFSLGHLAYALQSSQKSDAFGVIFPMEGIMASDVATHFPFSTPSSINLVKYLLPSMMVANCYLNSNYCNAKLSIKDNRVIVDGGYNDNFFNEKNKVTKIIKRSFRGLGAFIPPGAVKLANLGSDGHLAGTLPIKTDDDPLSCDINGKIRFFDRVYAADGSSLPWISSKHPTFTFMANAHRIGKHIASKY